MAIVPDNQLRVESAEDRTRRTRQPGGSPEEAREDARLLAAIARGDQGALEALYRRRSALLYSLLVRMLSNEMEAQEIMQDVFVQMWKRARECDPNRSSPVAWMVMLARGRAVDRLRSRSRRSVNHAAYEQEMASLEMEGGGLGKLERDELAAACASALHNLPEQQGQLLQLAFFRGWTHEEIAHAVGEPLGTVKTRIRRGLLALRSLLKDYHG